MALRWWKLAGLLVVAIIATYYLPPAFGSIVHLAFFGYYLYDRDEPLWLTFYFVISDGFIGFFNNYEAMVTVIPGLPEVEVGQLYVLGTLGKVFVRGGTAPPMFHMRFLAVLGIYTLFLIVQGYTIGVGGELRHHFRILKLVLPLALFFSLPRLFRSSDDFRAAFHLFLPFAVLALVAQVVTVATGLAPSQLLGLAQKLWFTDALKRGHTYRGFYSTSMVLISLFGALYYATTEPGTRWRSMYITVIIADLLSAFLSATRGWVLAFGVTLVLHALLVARVNARQVVLVTVLGTVLMAVMLRMPAVQRQFQGASDRILTLGLVVKGDITAGGTLARLDHRAPKVMAMWRESKLTGWGFADEYIARNDAHVGNHNMLFHAGIIGVALMAAFMIWFCAAMALRYLMLPAGSVAARGLLVFPLFLLGWFIIHSSSGQQFQFYGEPGGTIAQALFFTFAAHAYREAS